MSNTSQWVIGHKRNTEAWNDETTSPPSGAVQVGAGDKLLILSESLPSMGPGLIFDTNVGDSLVQNVLQGDRSGNGDLVLRARYEGFEKVLALYMGADTKTTASGETSGTGRQHAMEFQATNTGKYATIVMEKGVTDLWEFPFCKPNSLNLTHQEGFVVGTVNYTPNTVKRTDADRLNEDSDVSNLTAPSTQLAALFNQLEVALVEVTGSDVNLDYSTNKICVTNLTLESTRNHEAVVENCGVGVVGEPEGGSDLPSARLTLNLKDYATANDVYVAAAQARQDGSVPKVYKLSARWSGGDIPGSDASTGRGTAGVNVYELRFDFPALVVDPTTVPNARNLGRVPLDLVFQVQTAPSQPGGTDWSWVTAGTSTFRAVMINENDTAAA